MSPFIRRPFMAIRPLALRTMFLVVGASWVGLPAVVAAADAPGSCAGISATSAKNTWISQTISSATDVDWFRFTIASGTRAQATLGNLPADFDLSLYTGCATLVAESRRDGREFDEIYRYLPAGTYQLKVKGFNGAFSATPYSVRLRALASGTPVLSTSTWTDTSGRLHIAGEILNNTAEPRRWLQVDATLRDAGATAIGTAVGYAKVATVAPWSRAPFEIVTRKPTGFATASVRVCTPGASGTCLSGEATAAPFGGLTVQTSPSFLDSSGRRHYRGTVANAAPMTARLTRAVVTVYGPLGEVRGLASGFTEPRAVLSGATAGYEVVGVGSAAPNRYSTVATASSVGCTPGPRYGGAQENMVPPLARATASGRVALTFDMGGRMTPAVDILQLLVANGVCATIFPTGAISRTTQGQAALAVVKAHPELFELGNHTLNHCDLVRGGGGAPGATEATFCRSLAPSPTEAEVKLELTEGDRWIREYAGMVTTPLWRAPYGVSNLDVRTWAAEVGWTKHVKWDIDTIDWRPISDGGPTARSMTLKVVNGAKSGSIVLMHLGGYETLDALQSMIDGLRSRGFTLTSVSDVAQ
ncbi:MAG TPA: polysaccharide deacetylase family protein [Candidatus Limnocylindria bacterium]|nr:polysaccharide deacetylase family protein [Candidatus Limnocylindria bacterium]